ncbi:MAG TPA: T9SS type A sorting domain-containing protein [Candidatus Kapabacteria bacterium]|nr:T9SS type A sorting domain-containing protein [Candidatus Kapabacteria bacterium]
MKKISTILAVFCAVVLLAAPRASFAQTIAIDSVSGTTFCAGDPFSVTFTVTGTWGHTNAFTLQLSNDSGTFDNGFTKLGSVVDTAPGSFTINTSIPATTPYSSHYRVRIIGAYLYTVSTDNGSDIRVGEMPTNFVWGGTSDGPKNTVAMNDPIGLNFNAVNIQTNDDTVYIDYGSGASPATIVTLSQAFGGPNGPTVTYSTGGWKTVTLRSVGPGGCSVSDTFHVFVYDCTDPIVSHDAVIVSSNTTFSSNNESYMAFWVNPGISLTLGDNIGDTIYAEAGASISGQNGGQTYDIEYLKPGATSDPDFGGVVVYAPGAGVTTTGPEVQTLECSDLAFDYTVAPPNSVMHINEAVAPAEPLTPIEISPNPTSGIVSLQGVPANANVMAVNVLGEAVEEMKAPGSANFTLDLSKVTRGTYYIRIASNGSVTTKKIVKE